jgi:hypothetical protein
MDVDVKCAMGPPGLCALSIDEAIGRAESCVEPFGFAHLEPDMNDHALMIVLNVFQDGFRTAPWAVEDLRRVVRQGAFNAQTLVDRAIAGRVTTALWITADWLSETQGAPEWRRVRERIGRHPPSPRAARSYAVWRRFGSPRRVGHFVLPTLCDDAWGVAAGLAQATAGLARGYGLRAADWISETTSPPAHRG